MGTLNSIYPVTGKQSDEVNITAKGDNLSSGDSIFIVDQSRTELN